MFSIPYFGVYANDYTFFTPVNILKKLNPSNQIIKTFPELLKETIQEFRIKFNVDSDFFQITLDGSFIFDKFKQTNFNHYLRVNTVLHPYIFYDLEKLHRDHRDTEI